MTQTSLLDLAEPDLSRLCPMAQRVAQLFLTRGRFTKIDAHELLAVGGFAAWRTRVSDVRREFQRQGLGTIANATTRHPGRTESHYWWAS